MVQFNSVRIHGKDTTDRVGPIASLYDKTNIRVKNTNSYNSKSQLRFDFVIISDHGPSLKT